MNRPTHQLTTGSGHVVVLHDYITGQEYRDIRAVYIRGLKKPAADRDEAALDFEADNIAIQAAVVSLDDSSDALLERILALPLADFKEVVAEVSDLTEGKKK